MSISKKEIDGLMAVQTAIDTIMNFAEEVQWDGKKELEALTSELWAEKIDHHLKKQGELI